jgi:hypothetical protein
MLTASSKAKSQAIFQCRHQPKSSFRELGDSNGDVIHRKCGVGMPRSSSQASKESRIANIASPNGRDPLPELIVTRGNQRPGQHSQLFSPTEILPAESENQVGLRFVRQREGSKWARALIKSGLRRGLGK